MQALFYILIKNSAIFFNLSADLSFSDTSQCRNLYAETEIKEGVGFKMKDVWKWWNIQEEKNISQERVYFLKFYYTISLHVKPVTITQLGMYVFSLRLSGSFQSDRKEHQYISRFTRNLSNIFHL